MPEVFFREVLPDLSKQVYHDFRRLRRMDLAEQVMALRIVDRCRCGSEYCGAFKTESSVAPAPQTEASQPHNLRGGLVHEVRGRKVRIETFGSGIDRRMREIFP